LKKRPSRQPSTRRSRSSTRCPRRGGRLVSVTDVAHIRGILQGFDTIPRNRSISKAPTTSGSDILWVWHACLATIGCRMSCN
jgi:hypothetical protein